ncbi:TIGR00730 family Rossman fold protein [Herbaspirillum sp. LeCh32-8]|nr:TIGR00730 family Rossman fold protein [Herbaspirillum sp. LeCh32-8]
MRSIAVFCGSNFGNSPEYGDAARALGAELGRRGIRLVYGGTNKGLMGVTAEAALAAGAEVTGVITRRLHERGHLAAGLSSHEIVADMRVRKARMAELADAFIALPGGLGTFEELFEVATLTQLGDHSKACGVLNVRGFYEPMRAMLALATEQGFMKPEHRDMIVAADTPGPLLDAIESWTAPTVTKWIAQPGS